MNNDPNTLPPTDEVAELRDVKALADKVVLRVCEYDDRTSPEDWPEALLITPEELHAELMQFAEALRTPARPAPTDVELDELERVARRADANQDSYVAVELFDIAFQPKTVLKLIAALRAPAVPREVEALTKTVDALVALLAAVKASPSMQGREYVGLGIQVNNAIDAGNRALAALRASPTPAGGDGALAAAARAVVEATTQDERGGWIITGDGERLIGDLMDALPPITPDSHCPAADDAGER